MSLTCLFHATETETPRFFSLWTRVKPLLNAGYALTVRVRPTGLERRQVLEPEWLVKGMSFPAKLASDGTYLYWENGGAIARCLLDGSKLEGEWVKLVRPLVGPVFTRGGAGLAIDTTHIYFATEDEGEGENGRIGRVKLDGTGLEEELFVGGVRVGGLAVDETHLYWCYQGAAGHAKVGRAVKTGGVVKEVEPTWYETAASFFPTGLFLHGSGPGERLYFWATRAGFTGISSITVAGTEFTDVVKTNIEAHQMTSYEGFLAWVQASESNGVRRQVGEENAPWFESPALPVSAGGVLIVGEYIYWSNRGATSGAIGRARLSEIGLEIVGGNEWEFRLEKRLGGQNLLASYVHPGMLAEGWHEVELGLDVEGNFNIKLDGETIFTSVDAVLRGGYVGLEGSPTGSLGERQLTMDAELLDALEEEGPLSANWTQLPWATDMGTDNGAAGWQPSSADSGAFWNAQWFGEPEPEPPPEEEPEGEPPPEESTVALAGSGVGVVPFRGVR